MVMPGETVNFTVELLPESPIAMDEGLRFAIREGGRTVGGVVTKILLNRQFRKLAWARPAGNQPAGRKPWEMSGTGTRWKAKVESCVSMFGLNARKLGSQLRVQKETKGADRLERKKYCPRLRKVTIHKESRKK